MTICQHCGGTLTEDELNALPTYDVDLCADCTAYLLARDLEERRDADAAYEKERLP